MKIGLIFGGKSAEHEVSLMSAKSIYDNLDKNKHQVYLIGMDRQGDAYYFDGPIEHVKDGTWEKEKSSLEVVFYDNHKKPGIYNGEEKIAAFDIFIPVLHGPYGEDGKIQGLLELSGIPYVGCGVLASALAMDKDIAKKVFAHAGIPQVNHSTITIYDDIEKKIEDIEATLGYPMFIKPANMGSSVGVSKAKNKGELHASLQKAFEYDHKVIVEQGLNPREIEVSVLGNLDEVLVSNPGEIIPSEEFYDYDAKYVDGTSVLLIPAPTTTAQTALIKDLAQKAFRAIGGEGLSRIDFFIDKNTDKVYLNEINSMPGFTSISMYPKLWEHDGISYKELIERLMELAIRRKEREDDKKSR